MGLVQRKIGFIGAGNMCKAMLSGFLAKGIAKNALMVSDHKHENIQQIAKRFGVATTVSNSDLAADADIIILAVKPQQMVSAIESMGKVSGSKTVISIAAGIEVKQLQRFLQNGSVHVIRAMPNTPAVIGEGITTLYSPQTLSASQKEMFETLFSSLGQTLWVEDEQLMHVATALAGSGPAFIYYFLECLIQGGIENGLSSQQATKLATQTALGAIKMATIQPEDLSTLRKQVTSKGGTTEQGLNYLFDNGFSELLVETINQATNRSKELAKQATTE